MGFLDIGIWEIVLILMVALIIWGPGRIPEIGRALGRILRTLRKASSDLTSNLTSELTKEGNEKDRPPRQKRESSDK